MSLRSVAHALGVYTVRRLRLLHRTLGSPWLAAAFGRDAVLTQMSLFFTKAALMTFGGAYAVLPYLYQGAVDHPHWHKAAQMMDGLVLGETTPARSSWSSRLSGLSVDGPTPSSAPTRCHGRSGRSRRGDDFTVLPSFFFILLGGPFIEPTHGNLKFTAPLTGITAAVVGVIVNMAVFFAALGPCAGHLRGCHRRPVSGE